MLTTRSSRAFSRPSALLLVEDLDIDGDLDLPTGDGHLTVFAALISHRQIGLVSGDRTADDRVRLRLGGLPEAQALLNRLAHGTRDLLGQGGLRSLVVERQHRHRLDRGRKAAAGEAIAAAEDQS